MTLLDGTTATERIWSGFPKGDEIDLVDRPRSPSENPGQISPSLRVALEMSALFDPVLDRSTRSISARIEQDRLIPAATQLVPSNNVML
jgi:hypothetical protein